MVISGWHHYGAAFKSIVSSQVNDIVMPLIGIIIGGISFSEMNIAIGTAVVNYGLFIQAVVDFLIIAVVIFLMVKGINNLEKKKKRSLRHHQHLAMKKCCYQRFEIY